MLISVVIPTHNRHALALEAIQSVAAQTYRDWEVVVVDDGSDPPISSTLVAELLGGHARLVRNSYAQGVPKAKNAGVRLASGEIILILDDDDLLVNNALELIAHHYQTYPDLDCLFLGVEPFGPYAAGPARSRQLALDRLQRRCVPTEVGGLFLFSSNLFDALLVSVPIDFQRPAARRGTWNSVGGFGETSLFSEPSLAIKIAASHKVALTARPLTRWRIHDSNFGWDPNLNAKQNESRHLENGLQATAELLREFGERGSAVNSQHRRLKAAYAEQLFGAAYFYHGVDRPRGLAFLLRSFATRPQWKHLRLMLTYFLPKRSHVEAN